MREERDKGKGVAGERGKGKGVREERERGEGGLEKERQECRRRWGSWEWK